MCYKWVMMTPEKKTGNRICFQVLCASKNRMLRFRFWSKEPLPSLYHLMAWLVSKILIHEKTIGQKLILPNIIWCNVLKTRLKIEQRMIFNLIHGITIILFSSFFMSCVHSTNWMFQIFYLDRYPMCSNMRGFY